MKISHPDIRSLILITLMIGLVIGLSWANYQFTEENPGGNDFIPRWVGTRMFISDRLSPYSNVTSMAIQDFFYGRPAQGDEDLQLFVYPHYSMVVFAPFSLIEDYPLARSLWMTALEVSLIAVVFISLTLTKWRPPAKIFAIFLFFSLTWYHGVRPVINGNAAPLVALFIALAFYFIQTEWDRAAGIFLAFSTIKPQMVVLLIPLVIVWAISRRRWPLILSFMISMTILVGTSLVIQSDWIINNLQQILIYPQYTEPGAPGSIFSVWWPDLGGELGLLLSGILTIVLILEWRAVLGKEFRWFFWVACLTLVVTNLIGIRTATANYIALFPALTLVFSVWDQRWGRGGRWLAIFFMVAIFWGLWSLFLNTVATGAGGQPIQSLILFFPLPIFLIIGIYWVRWWAIKPRREV